MMKKIKFVLTDPTPRIVGGYKMVYIYANALAEAGYDVEITYRCYRKYSPQILTLMNYAYRYWLTRKKIPWFPLSNKVKRSMVLQIKKMESADLIIATSVHTAKELWEKDLWKDHVIAYLIQDYETWAESEEHLDETYRYGFKNIVIAKWLEELVYQKSGTRPFYVPNGIDCSVFCCRAAYNERPAHSIAMLYHNQARKGAADGLKAIYKLKELFPDLTAELFGSPERPDDLPEWIAYTRNAKPAEVAAIFNRNRICFMPSKREGFGLTGFEAMACGALLITTPCEGVFDYAIDKKNAFITQDFEYVSFVELTTYCFENPEVASQTCQEGIETGRRFDVKTCQKKMVDYIGRL